MLSGVILAGGKNFTFDAKMKSVLPFGEELLIQRQIKEMKKICTEIIVVTDQPRTLLSLVDTSIRIITDYGTWTGPLSGMYAAFSLAQYTTFWLVGGDHPFVSAQAAQFMLETKQKEKCEAIIPVVDRQHDLYHAIYDQACLPAIQQFITRKENRTEDLLASIDWKPVYQERLTQADILLNFIYQIKSKEDYLAALARLHQVKEEHMA